MPPSSAQAYQSLTAFKPRDTKDVVAEAETKYDLPGRTKRVSDLRGLVGNLQSAVEAVDPSVTGRTAGTFTTEGQRSALVNRERAPILGDLGKQQNALSEEQVGLTNSQSLATQMASALMSQDQTTYQRLLDQYNAARASEQAAEEKRRFEETMRLEREKMAASERASKAASSGGGYNLSSLLSSASDASGGGGDQNIVKQTAMADVGKLLTRIGTRSFLDEVKAIYKSAGYGNTYDQAKLELIAAKQPGLFQGGKLNTRRLNQLWNMYSR